MKDLTIVQTVTKLRNMFPKHTCHASYEVMSYGHHPITEKLAPIKKIYVSEIPLLGSIEGPSFRILLRAAQVVRGQI